ncbi:MAG: acyloxyacyl hydrolase [Pseudomonadota bacterium]
MRAPSLKLFCLSLLAALTFGLTSAAHADGHGEAPNPFFIDELRFGVLDHDAPSNAHESGSIDVNAELLFHKLDIYSDKFDNYFWRVLTTPRPHVGVVINTAGDTSYAYTGLTWRGDIGPILFIEGTFGFMVHNGENGKFINGRSIVPGKPNRAALGQEYLFRESIAIGAQITKKISILAIAEHVSHAGILTPVNNGLTSWGVKMGYKF